MAIAFARVSVHTRTKGHSAPAAAAYRAGTKLLDSRTGITHDYSKRCDVVFSTILLPENADLKFSDREFLWNQVEIAEKRRDAQVCKDIVLALPKELNLSQQIELTERFAQKYFVEQGLPADIAIHDHGDGNPHAHILISTRRLEKNRFSKHKARDLNPTFANKNIVEKEFWGEQWRNFQNQYFRENELNLLVDANHLITDRHTGQIKPETHPYLFEEKQLIKAARVEIARKTPELFIQKISQTHSVFTRRDIEKLVFKTFDKTDEASDYLQIISKILEHKNIIKLGPNEHGADCYATYEQYCQEERLLTNIEELHKRKSHVNYYNLDRLIRRYNLNEEQAEALQFIAKGKDISVLIGRPGVGKSYLLKPIKEQYESNGSIVLGASLSGKVAKALQDDTGISSSTIASLIYRLDNQQLTLTKQHVLIIDEAGMVDVSSMSHLLEAVNKACAKIILVGDPDQLKPIHKGEIFRGIAARIGYIELDNIRRQKDLGDRKASLALARGKIAEAVQHYYSKGALEFLEDSEQATTALINAWQKDLNTTPLKNQCILAFTRSAVDILNTKARAAAQELGLVQKKSFEYYSQNGENTLMLAKGDRILLRVIIILPA
jgi:Ti-type conjugative transfer relaxase TraA